MREATEEDARDLAFCDGEWSATDFADLLGTPGAGGVFDGDDCFAVGMACGAELHVTRYRAPGREALEDLIAAILQRWDVVKFEFSLEKRDHAQIIRFHDRGFTPECTGEMRIHMRLDRAAT